MLTNENIIKAKLHVPQLPSDFVVRHSIIEKLDRNREASIFLFSAPSGYGKSTTTLHWLKNKGLNFCWLSLDETDNYIGNFVHYLILCVQSVVPGFGNDILEISESVQQPTAIDYDQLLSNAFEHLNEEVYIVLDDYHFIRNKDIHDLLIKLLQFPHPHLKLVFTSRRDPPFPLSTYRMKHKLTEIRAKELSFDPKEIGEFAINQKLSSPSEATIDFLMNISEGWISGLRLLSLAGFVRDHKGWRPSASVMTDHYILMELVQETLNLQPYSMRSNILKMSLIDEFNKELYDLITVQEGNNSTSGPEIQFKDFVDNLFSSNLFILHLDDGNQWFRFHHLFHDLLQQILLKECEETEILGIYRSIASWYRDNDQVEKGIEFMLKGRQKKEAIAYFETVRPKIFEDSNWQFLERLIDLFDDAILNETLVLKLSQAWLYIYKGDIKKMSLLLTGLERLYLEAGLSWEDKGHYLGEINVFKAFTRYNYDIDMNACLEFALTALSLLNKDNYYAIGLAWIFYGGAMQALGKSDIAQKDITAELDKCEIPNVGSNLYLILCYIHWLDGNIKMLSETAAFLIQFGKINHLKEAEANGYYFSGCANFAKNNKAKALEDLIKLYELRQFTIMVHRFFGNAIKLFLLLDRGDLSPMLDLLEEMKISAMERGGVQYMGIYKALEASLNWKKSKDPESLNWAMNNSYLPLIPMSNSTSEPILQAGILVSSGQVVHAQRAVQILDDCIAFLEKYNNRNFLCQALVLKACSMLTLGGPEAAGKEFTRALKISKPLNFIYPFLQVDPDDLALLIKISNASPNEKGFLDDLQLQKIVPKRPPASVLSRREQEILELILENLQNKQIAEKLFISDKTVKRHIANIYNKLEVHNRQQLVEKMKNMSL